MCLQLLLTMQGRDIDAGPFDLEPQSAGKSIFTSAFTVPSESTGAKDTDCRVKVLYSPNVPSFKTMRQAVYMRIPSKASCCLPLLLLSVTSAPLLTMS